MDGLQLVPVATGLSDLDAKLLAARLGAEGILWQTRGIVDSICPFGDIDVLVPADQLDDARHVLAVVGGRGDPELAVAGTVPSRHSGPTWWFGLVAVGLAATFTMVRLLVYLWI